MSLIELLIIAVGLSMDAFAVSICKGLSAGSATIPQMLTVGLYFGGFQALMPTVGYLAGSRFQSVISAYDHWIAFILLVLIGGNMIRESREEGECANPSFAIKTMLPLAVATSIDALAVGVSFAFLQVRIIPAVCCIGVVTCIISAAGLKTGAVFGSRYQSRAELAGGIILIVMGLKILLEHTGVLTL